MQNMYLKIITAVKKERIKSLDKDMREIVIGNKEGALFICPLCSYHSKKNSKGTAKIFTDNKIKFFKCFACSEWRKFK